MSNRNDLLFTRYILWGPYCSSFSFLGFFLLFLLLLLVLFSSHSGLCAQYCLCLWTVNFCFIIRLSPCVLSYQCLQPYISRQVDLDRGEIFASYYELTDEIPWSCVCIWNLKHLRWVPDRDDSQLVKCISM